MRSPVRIRSSALTLEDVENNGFRGFIVSEEKENTPVRIQLSALTLEDVENNGFRGFIFLIIDSSSYQLLLEKFIEKQYNLNDK